MKIKQVTTLQTMPQTEDDRENYILGFVASVNEVDRTREVLDLSTMDVGAFARAGSFTLFHEHQRYPIGVPVRLTIDDNKLKVWVKFDVGKADDDTRSAEISYNKVLSGSLINVSVEVRDTPQTIGEIIEEENDLLYVVYKNTELLQLSLVVTPANAFSSAINTNRPRCQITDMRGQSYDDLQEQLSTIT